MARGKKSTTRKKKVVSWIEDPNSDDGMSTIGKNICHSEDVENGVDTLVKCRSLDEHVKRPKILTLSKSASTRMPPPSEESRNSCNPSMEWLEMTLLRRWSETRSFKYNTRLLESIPDGDTAFISRMLAMGASPNATCRLNHVSACHLAAMYPHDALDVLIKAGAETLRYDKVGRTPLHLAAWEGSVKQIAVLFNFPKALQESVCFEITPEAIEEVKKHSEVVHQLTNMPCAFKIRTTLPDAWSDGMEHNCRHNKEMLPLFQPGWTALHAASARTHHQVVKLLLAAGADVSAQDLLRRSPLDVVGLAFYMGQILPKGHTINVSEETMRILLEAGGEFQDKIASRVRVNTPLHTAVELGSEEAVEDLLNLGASPTLWNVHGFTAMHVSVKNMNKEILQLLTNYVSDENDKVARVDTKDRWGFTVLRAAIKQGWTQGVCIALGAGASITMEANDGESPIHVAAALGNTDILQQILTVAKFNSTVDFRNEERQTALFIAISKGHIDAVKLLVDAGAMIEAIGPNEVSVFHLAAQHGHEQILKYLLEHKNQVIVETMINSFDNNNLSPLLHAVLKNHPNCVKLLISKGASVNYAIEYNNGESISGIVTTPLHIAASKNYVEIAMIIINHDISTIHAIDSVGHLPLHEACSAGSREIIKLLLKKGADLSIPSVSSKTKLTPIDLLMNNLSKPTAFMQEVFDSCIANQSQNPQESNCEVRVDYGILMPMENDGKQMRVIKALVNTGNRYNQSTLLLHPLVQSFLYLKWKALLPFFYTILVLHGCFVMALNVYVVSVFYYKDKNMNNTDGTPHKERIVPFYLQSNIWKHIVYVTICLIAIQEIIFIKIKSRRYLLCLETWLKLWTIALAVFLPGAISWESESSPEWARLIATLALLFSWFEMMFLLSRFPDWGFYVLMFGKVANKVFKILLSFVFLIFGFSICFMIQYRAQQPFEGPWASFVKTFVMMTSEFDYQQTINKDNATKLSASIIILRAVFLSFVILVSIVLMNLIVGVAVNNVNNLEMIGNIKRLEKQVEFITSLEDIVSHKVMRKILPKRIYTWSNSHKMRKRITLRAGYYCVYYRRLPDHIKESIFEKAQLQKQQMDVELGEIEFKTKVHEIHNAIVLKNESDLVKSDDTKEETADRNILEQIEKMRADIEFIKDFLVSNRRPRLSTNNSSNL